MNFSIKCLLLLVVSFSGSFTLFADTPATACNIDAPLVDKNDDGYADEFVSPAAQIQRSEIDCSAHTIGSGAVIVDASISTVVVIRPNALINRSVLSLYSTIGSRSKVIDSEVTSDSHVGSSTVIASGSYISDDVKIGMNSRVVKSRVANSNIGNRAVIINDSEIFNSSIGSNVQISGADLYGSEFYGSDNKIGAGTRIAIGSTLLGPFDIGENSKIGRNVHLQNSTFGEQFRIGNGSSISFASSIANNVTIGHRVTIGRFAVISDNTLIGDDVMLGALTELGESAKINARAKLGNSVHLGANSSIGSQSRVSDLVDIGAEVVIGRNSSIGLSAQIGDGAVVLAGSTVPGEFVVESDTVFPSDYAEFTN